MITLHGLGRTITLGSLNNVFLRGCLDRRAREGREGIPRPSRLLRGSGHQIHFLPIVDFVKVAL